MEYATCFPIVTDQDHARLCALIEATTSADKERLRNELARAHIVPQSIVPPDIVTMHSVVTYEEEDTGRRSQVALVYPQNADASVGLVSILEPLGISLLGVRVGHTAKWTAPNGKLKTIKVVSIAFQPEALGAYEL